MDRLPQLGATVLVAAIMMGGCVGQRPDTCKTQSECDAGAFCGSAGFCISECKQDRDCPCGSFCAGKCGLCIRDDLAGTASCFARHRGLSESDALGLCRGDRPDAGRKQAGDDGGQRRICDEPPDPLPVCAVIFPDPATPMDAGKATTSGDDAGLSSRDASVADAGDNPPGDAGTDGGAGDAVQDGGE